MLTFGVLLPWLQTPVAGPVSLALVPIIMLSILSLPIWVTRPRQERRGESIGA